MKDVGARPQGRERGRQGARSSANMSTRASAMLHEDMEFMGPVKRRSVEEAQGRIVAIVRRLEETGKIQIARGGAGAEDELGRASAAWPRSRIIARATAAGTRRLTAVPLEPLRRAGRARPPSRRGHRRRQPTGLNAFLATAQRQGAELVEVAREQAERHRRERARARAIDAGYEEGRAQAAARGRRPAAVRRDGRPRGRRDTRARLHRGERDGARRARHPGRPRRSSRRRSPPSRERVTDVLRGALRKAYVRDRLQVVCNPDDLALIEGAEDALQAQVGDAQGPRADRRPPRAARRRDRAHAGRRRRRHARLPARPPRGPPCSARTRVTDDRHGRLAHYARAAARGRPVPHRWAASPR